MALGIYWSMNLFEIIVTEFELLQCNCILSIACSLKSDSTGQSALIRFHIIAYRSGKKKDKKYRKPLKTLGIAIGSYCG